MIGDQIQAPDLIQEVTAWRTWTVKDSHLTSMSFRDRWGKHMSAECHLHGKRDVFDVEHKVPFESCGCGLYGFYEYEEVKSRRCDAVGVVKYWGECQAHQTGLRAEHAKVVAVTPVWWRGVGDFLTVVKVLKPMFVGGLLFNFVVGFFELQKAHDTTFNIMTGMLVGFLACFLWYKMRTVLRTKKWASRHDVHFHFLSRSLHRYHTQPMPQCFRTEDL
jgi:hypothetical protein